MATTLFCLVSFSLSHSERCFLFLTVKKNRHTPLKWIQGKWALLRKSCRTWDWRSSVGFNAEANTFVVQFLDKLISRSLNFFIFNIWLMWQLTKLIYLMCLSLNYNYTETSPQHFQVHVTLLIPQMKNLRPQIRSLPYPGAQS